MTPTAEQRAILKATGRVIRINARAGTGKTTTLRMLSNEHSGRKILYLVFNKKAQKEAESKFPSHVTVKTLHSLALGSMWGKRYEIADFSPKDLLAFFRNKEEQQALAKISHDLLVFFLNSPHERVRDALGEFKSTLPAAAEELCTKFSEEIIHAARNTASDWHRERKPCPHDFYLKMSHRGGEFHRALRRYDMVLVDEAQDLSGVMLDALEKYEKRVVIVGDTHQQIYGFRYAVDAMHRLAVDEDFDLTSSFRFGKEVADLATLLIKETKGENDFVIHGSAKKSSTVAVVDSIPMDGCAILSRTNLSLFSKAMELRSKGVKFKFERNIEGILSNTLDVYWLAQEQKGKIKSEWIGSFDNLKSLEEYAEHCDDFSLQGMSHIVKKYSSAFPDIIPEMCKVIRGQAAGRGNGDVILSTVHSAKGQEYGKVFIDSDIVDNLEASLKADSVYSHEEANIAYVGITRAKERLLLPPAFHRLLGPGLQELLKSFKTSRRQGESKPHTGKKSSFAGTNGALPFPVKKMKRTGPKKRRSDPVKPQPGERVETPHGQGVVMEVSGDKCLIRLDDQLATVWEWASRLTLGSGREKENGK